MLKTRKKLYFMITGMGAVLALGLLMASPLLAAFHLQWRSAVRCTLIFMAAFSLLMLLAGCVCLLFKCVWTEKRMKAINVILGLVCLQACLFVTFLGVLVFGYNNQSETVTVRNGEKYVTVEDDYAGHYGRMYVYHGALVMGKEWIDQQPCEK